MNPLFTRKHYIVIAELLRVLRATIPGPHCAVARAFADALAHDNPSFDRSRFLSAAGLED
jgi:hypothetical protein